MRRIIFLLVICISCSQTKKIDLKKQEEIVSLADNILHSKKIDSQKVLAVIKSHCTDIYKDTVISRFRPASLIYANTDADTFFKICKEPNGQISVITFYKSDKEIATSEFYDNGQIMCLFEVDNENGPYQCFHKNGKLRVTGQNKNGHSVGVETGYDSLGVKIYEHTYK